MTAYLINIIATLLFGGVAMQISYKKNCEQNKRYLMWIFVIIILFFWVFLYAMRDNVGSDYVVYKSYYQRIGRGNQNLQETIEGQRDVLFGMLEYISHKVSNGNWRFFLGVLGVVTYLPILTTLRKESSNFVVSSTLYIFMLSFYSGYNGSRQAIAVSLSFYAYYLLFRQKKYKSYIMMILIAFGFHSTVLFVFPFHLLTMKKLKSKFFKGVIALMLFAYVFMWNLWMYLIDFFEFLGQDKLASDYADATLDGSGYLRLVVYLLPVVLALMFYKKIKNKYPNTDCEIMFMIISTVFMLFSTKYWLFARIAEYFSVSTMLFIPKLECIFTRDSKKVGMSIVMILYFAFMCMLLLHGEGGYYPYKMADL